MTSPKTTAFGFNGRIRSVKYALNGIALVLRTQHNAWVHAVATVAVIGAAAAFDVTRVEWCLLIPAEQRIGLSGVTIDRLNSMNRGTI